MSDFLFFFFVQWKCFAWELILFWLRGRQWEAKGHGRDHLRDARRWGLFFWRGFWVMFSNVKKKKTTKPRESTKARSESLIEIILSLSYFEWDLIGQPQIPPTGDEDITSPRWTNHQDIRWAEHSGQQGAPAMCEDQQMKSATDTETSSNQGKLQSEIWAFWKVWYLHVGRQLVAVLYRHCCCL